MRVDLVGPLESGRGMAGGSEKDEIKEIVMAKVIEFYVPNNFRKPLKWIPVLHPGKIVEFGSQTKKSA